MQTFHSFFSIVQKFERKAEAPEPLLSLFSLLFLRASRNCFDSGKRRRARAPAKLRPAPHQKRVGQDETEPPTPSAPHAAST